MQLLVTNIDGEKQDTDDYIRALDAAQKQMIVDAKVLMDANPGMLRDKLGKQAAQFLKAFRLSTLMTTLVFLKVRKI